MITAEAISAPHFHRSCGLQQPAATTSVSAHHPSIHSGHTAALGKAQLFFSSLRTVHWAGFVLQLVFFKDGFAKTP